MYIETTPSKKTADGREFCKCTLKGNSAVYRYCRFPDVRKFGQIQQRLRN